MLTQVFGCAVRSEREQINFPERIVNFAIENREQSIELPGLYDSLSKGPPEKSVLILANILEKKGFTEVESGRGNYPPRGPRIVIKKFKKDDCVCVVSKIYYSTTYDTLFEMAERISCVSEPK